LLNFIIFIYLNIGKNCNISFIYNCINLYIQSKHNHNNAHKLWAIIYNLNIKQIKGPRNFRKGKILIFWEHFIISNNYIYRKKCHHDIYVLSMDRQNFSFKIRVSNNNLLMNFIYLNLRKIHFILVLLHKRIWFIKFVFLYVILSTF